MNGMRKKTKKWKAMAAAVVLAVGFWVVPQGALARTAVSGSSSSFNLNGADAGSSGTAVGDDAEATGSWSVAVGDAAKATGDWSIAIGDGAEASSSDPTKEDEAEGCTIAIGTYATASGNYSTAIGTHAEATGKRSLAAGQQAEASGIDSMSLGNFAVAEGEESIAIGYSADALSFGSIAFGRDSEASGGQAASAFGYGSKATQMAALALGAFSEASGVVSIAIGANSQASNQLATAVGYMTYAAGEGASVFGNNSTAQGTGAVAIGYQSVANDNKTQDAAGNTINFVSFGHKDGDEYIYMNSESKIVKGNYSDNSYSRLTNVDKGTKANEAATWDQLISGISYDADTGTLTLSTNTKDVSYSTVITTGGGGGDGKTYQAGNGIEITNPTSTTPTISVKTAEKGGLSADENGLAVKVAENGGLTVDDKGLSVQKDGKVESGNTGLVTGGTVYEALKDMDNQVSELSNDINKVGAGAAALAALRPEAFNPDDKWSFAVGYGHYKNANAGALGVFFKPNADMTISLGGTLGNGDSMMNMGVSFKLGSKGKKAGTYLSAVDLVQRIDALEATMVREVKRNDIQDSRLIAQEKEIKALRVDSSSQAQKIAQLQADIARMQQQIANLLSDNGMVIR